MIAPKNEYAENDLFNKIKIVKENKEKGSFYCSDYGKNPLDLYFKLKNEPETDPMDWPTMARLGAGKGAEVEMLQLFKDNGIVPADYEQETHGRVDFIREGIEIHGYIDAIVGENDKGLEVGSPIEIKTINNANRFDVARYFEGNPRENYVGQLAIYMDFLGKETGYLFAISLDGLNKFWFECKKIGEHEYKCGNTIVNVLNEYKRWADVFKNVLENKIPEWNVRYKVPVEEIDWSLMETEKIKKALLGTVIGDPDKWQIDYSPYKTKILELQGQSLGYTDLEKQKIRELSGYDIINGRMTKRK